MLRIRTFGSCCVERDGVRLDGLSGQRKVLALLALLAAAGERGVSRDTVVAHLWPESDEERARTSLKQLVHSLRAQLRAPDLVSSTAELRLNPERIASDVSDFRTARGRGDHASAVALYAGPFLDGFYLKDADGFERWAATERGALAHDAARSLETLAEQATAAGELRAAAEWWRKLAHAEPLSARAATGLMRALDAVGDRTAALQYARVHELVVREEVGGPPDPSVTALVDHLQRGAAPLPPRIEPPAAVPSGGQSSAATDRLLATPSASGARPGADWPRWRNGILVVTSALVLAGLGARARWEQDRSVRAMAASALLPGGSAANSPSVAVLPFVNTSGDPADEPFSDGLTDEVIGALSQLPALKVAGRTSAYALKGRGLGVRAIAETLGVATVLEGSVRRSGPRLKVSAQLVNAGDNAVLWAGTYDRELREIFALQEEIAQAIVSALRVRLEGPVATALVRQATADPAAYELYLRGRYIMNTRVGREGVLAAVRLFEQAVARDSTFARAWAGLSDAHARLAVFGYGRPRVEIAQARDFAGRALALDSSLADAHVSLAHILFVYDFDWKAAEREFRRATALDPGYSFGRMAFSMCLMAQARFDEAAAQLDTAHAADPLAAAVSNLQGRVYVSARKPDLAIPKLREALELNSQLDLAYEQLGHAYLQKGMREEAIVALRRAAALSGPRDSAQLAYAYAISGRRTEALRIVRALLDSSGRRYLPPYHIAMAYAGLGQRDEAFRWLDRAYSERGSFMGGVNVEPGFESLHADPRWVRLIRRMGLAT